jgi:RimJ/RimL family protein N-acetyltransferase
MNEYPLEKGTLGSLFDPDLPNSPALWAVLMGNHPGRAVVDNIQNPSQCAVRTGAALSYSSHQITQAFLDDAIAYFCQIGPVWLVWPHGSALHPPQMEHTTLVKRLEFYDCDPRSGTILALKGKLPKGHSIQPINRQLLARCEWKAEMEFYTGSASNFLEHGLGLCMVRGGEIIVEAYASALGRTRAEIGAITREGYRGQGYAAVACAYLIEVCERRGYQATWSCDADHRASIRVAQKLGFQQARAYRIYEYDS